MHSGPFITHSVVLRIVRLVFVERGDHRGAVGVHVLDAKHLALNLVAHLQRHEVVSGLRDRRLIATESASAAATTTTLARRTQECLNLLEASRERAREILDVAALTGAFTSCGRTASA